MNAEEIITRWQEGTAAYRSNDPAAETVQVPEALFEAGRDAVAVLKWLLDGDIASVIGDAYAYRLGELDGEDDPDAEEDDEIGMKRARQVAFYLGVKFE